MRIAYEQRGTGEVCITMTTDEAHAFAARLRVAVSGSAPVQTVRDLTHMSQNIDDVALGLLASVTYSERK